MKRFAHLALVLPFLAGCASIIDGTSQSLSVDTQNSGKIVSDATCQLRNSKGQWVVQTPGTTAVRRAKDNILVSCDKSGFQAGSNFSASSFNTIVLLNILWWPGFIVDFVTGSSYEYQDHIVVEMKPGK